MKDFWKKANKYIKDNLDSIEKPKNFIYNNSEIEPEILIQLVKMKDNLDYYSEAYDREYDYSRLLRLENLDLKAYIEELESSIDIDQKICIDISGDGSMPS